MGPHRARQPARGPRRGCIWTPHARLPTMLGPWGAHLRATLDQMPRRVRAELLRALRLQPEALDEEIARGESDPGTQGWAGMLRELRE